MTRSAVAGSARFRQRKLSPRQTLQILREDQVDKVDDEAQRNVPKVETGVEKGEEIEHHLQAALSASQAAAVGGKVAQIYIPTPETVQSSIQYDRLYPLSFAQPATYIRFSSTVEDCCGCPYDINEEDDIFLKSSNKKRNASTQCSEDQFEEVMNFFEETAQTKQPYAAVDSPPVLTYEDMEGSFDENIDDAARGFARDIYEHWKRRRLETGNRLLTIGLKLETGADTDDADPYVCFRRREVRQIRKTRGRDAHSAEKLKKLRKELEESRQIMSLIRQREITKRDQLITERLLFEQRASLRQVKKNLPDQYQDGDEDLLITQKVSKRLLETKPLKACLEADLEKPQKKKPLEIVTQRPPGTQLRMLQRQDGRLGEADLVLLSDFIADQQAEIQRRIETKISRHEAWNEKYVDMTRAPLTPPLEENIRSSFRTAMTEYLPTPPASISSEHSGEVIADAGSPMHGKDDSIAVRYASPSYDGPCQSQPSFRRRFGRGGRLMIDRRGMRLQSKEGLEESIVDRFKYDNDDDDDEVSLYSVDPYDNSSIRYRAKMSSPQQIQQQVQAASRRPQLEGTPTRDSQASAPASIIHSRQHVPD